MRVCTRGDSNSRNWPIAGTSITCNAAGATGLRRTEQQKSTKHWAVFVCSKKASTKEEEDEFSKTSAVNRKRVEVRHEYEVFAALIDIITITVLHIVGWKTTVITLLLRFEIDILFTPATPETSHGFGHHAKSTLRSKPPLCFGSDWYFSIFLTMFATRQRTA